jgi:hypothetical protein
MVWEHESLALDTLNSLYNAFIKYNNYGGNKILRIDSLLVPPGSQEIKLMASANFVNATPQAEGDYDNYAVIEYEAIENNLPVIRLLQTEDRFTQEPVTTFYAEYQPRMDTVKVEVVTNPDAYRENGLIEVTYTITNPNDPLTDMYFIASYNDGFIYVNNSFTTTNINNAVRVNPDPLDDPNNPEPYLEIAGHVNGDTGFTLPSGVSVIKFKLKAPDISALVDEFDEFDQPTGSKEPLEIFHDFMSGMQDPCVIASMKEMSGVKVVPYKTGRTFIIVNEHITEKMK